MFAIVGVVVVLIAVAGTMSFMKSKREAQRIERQDKVTAKNALIEQALAVEKLAADINKMVGSGQTVKGEVVKLERSHPELAEDAKAIYAIVEKLDKAASDTKTLSNSIIKVKTAGESAGLSYEVMGHVKSLEKIEADLTAA